MSTLGRFLNVFDNSVFAGERWEVRGCGGLVCPYGLLLRVTGQGSESGEKSGIEARGPSGESQRGAGDK